MASFAALLKVGWEPDRPESCKPLFLTVMGAASPGQHAGQQQAALQLLNVSLVPLTGLRPCLCF